MGKYIILLGVTMLNISVLGLFGVSAFFLALFVSLMAFLSWAIYDAIHTDKEVHQRLSDIDDEINGLLKK